MALMDHRTVRERLRRQMAVCSQWAYFDHAAVSPLPQKTRDAITTYAAQAAENGDTVWPCWAQQVADARRAAAKLIHASVDEIALIPNTTYGINVVAEGYPWREGENVVVPANEFPSNLVPWNNLLRRGVDVRLVPIGEDGRIDVDVLRPYVDRQTRIISLSWVGFASGFRADLDSIVEFVRSQPQCYLFVDAIQGLGPYALDVDACPIDFLAADGHKWLLGPEGGGLLYVRRERLDVLQPLWLGWNSLAGGGFDPGNDKLKSSASRYEGGTYPMPSMIGFGASLDLLLELGAAVPDGPVTEAVEQNVTMIAQRLREAGFEVELPDETHRSGIVPVDWPGASSAELKLARKYLLERKIATSVRGNRLRISTHAYNNEEDIERLVTALAEFRSVKAA